MGFDHEINITDIKNNNTIEMSILEQFTNSNSAQKYLKEHIANNDESHMLELFHQTMGENNENMHYPKAYNALSTYIENKYGKNSDFLTKLPHQQNPQDGKTFLHRAVDLNNIELVKKLLEEDLTNPFIKDNKGLTAIDYAYQSDNQDLLQYFINQQCAIGVNWLNLPDGMDTKNNLIIGHVVKSDNNPSEHIFNVSTLEKATLSEESRRLILFRYKQYKNSNSKVKGISTHLLNMTFVLTDDVLLTEEQKQALDFTYNEAISEKPEATDTCEVDLRINGAEFKKCLNHMDEDIEKFKKNYERQKILGDMLNKDELIGSFGWAACAGATMYGIYQAAMGSMAIFGLMDHCLEETPYNETRYHTDGTTYNITHLNCTGGYEPGFDSNDWNNMLWAEMVPTVVFVGYLIGLQFAYKGVKKFLEVSRSKEDSRQKDILHEAQQLMRSITTDNPNATFDEIKKMISDHKNNIIEQDANLKIYPNLSFLNAPKDAANENTNLLDVCKKQEKNCLSLLTSFCS